tara:strand:+ start:1643 stop:2236 length:594 start_codon:yes stop_codon:yes gene_type:complete
MKTPGDFKRENIKAIFDKILKSEKTCFVPGQICITETADCEKTNVDFSFEERRGKQVYQHSFSSAEGCGFVDAVFSCCSRLLTPQYPSLGSISLVGLNVLPAFSYSSKTSASDAKVCVTFSLKTAQNDRADFTTTSKSIVNASFESIIKSFEFYVNCDRTFRSLRLFLDDAKKRNRYDVVQGILNDLAALTSVNTYV